MTARAAAEASGLPPYVEPCVPGGSAFASFSVVSIAPIGKPPPMPFASETGVGLHARDLKTKPRPEATDAGLHFVGEEQRAVLVAERPQRGEEAGRRGQNAALALHRLDDDGGHVVAHHLLHGLDVAVGKRGRRPRPRRSLRDTSACR